ncbi:hypothetical protein K493DRAFT_409868 [Basidiobolus meristosporus CBS 931.73]|uniref:Probable RNA polymerase II nuclear localization protein SLC7A6OS n=1 Tax=Basidiobolus meristosporus CBS 931.73 TaxID=1314790 RepID=A0A1Y1XXE1_9FUNG|nr:hypothetical protein K493DRAFT_409868 [Basidiobolus meristosporus CBS 931.73]|eukprot:ORX90429.1 hypothetical protein K493DRAFT_409868 [Basidiobolus meristosporus CBS 931.73]
MAEIIPAQQHTGSLTILRIKRKRTDEPLEALLVQDELSGVKKLRKNRKIAVPKMFRLAETVTHEIFGDAEKTLELKDKLAKMTNTTPAPPPIPTAPVSRRETGPPEVLSSSQQKAQQKIESTRYKVINQNRIDDIMGEESQRDNNGFRLFDVVREEDYDREALKTAKFTSEDPNSDIMCNFLPMLREYLSVNDKPVEEELHDDEYVYDVYYRDDANHATTMPSVKLASLIWFDDPEDNVFLHDEGDSSDFEGDEDSNAEDYYKNEYPEEEAWTDFDEYENEEGLDHEEEPSSDEYDYY